MHPRARRAVVLSLVLGVLGFGSSAQAATYYVSPTGSDLSAGSITTPWKTVGKALVAMKAGDTTFLRAGTYEERLQTACDSKQNRLNWTTSGTATAPITLSGYPGEEKAVVLKTFLSLTGNFQTVKNLVMDRNRAYSSFDSACTGATGINIWGDNTTLDAVEIRNQAMSGVYLEGADRVKIMRSRIHHNGTHYNLDHGIYYKTGVDGLIVNNVFDYNWAAGIKLGPGPTRPIAAQNTVVRNGAGGKGSGIMIGGDTTKVATGARVVNNISVYNKEFGIRSFWEGSAGTANVVDRNLIYGNTSGPSWYPKGGVTESRSMLIIPGLMNIDAGDYRLTAPSLAIGAADIGYSYSPDYAGRSRDSAPDLGALEY